MGVSIYLSLENKAHFTHYLTLSPDGSISIGNISIDNISINNESSYQILATSRLSFIGCWLRLQQNTHSINPNNHNKQIPFTHRFIFKDSLSEQDYARLVSVLKQISE